MIARFNAHLKLLLDHTGLSETLDMSAYPADPVTETEQSEV